MKICFISSKSIHTRRWIEFFTEKGHEIHLITNKDDEYRDIKVYKINPRYWILSPIIKALIVKNIIQNVNPDIVHSHQVIPFGLYGSLARFHPHIVSAWGSDILINPKSKLYKYIYKYMIMYILNNADLITCDGLNSKEAIEKMNCDLNVKVIYHGVNTKLFNPNVKDDSVKETPHIENLNTVISIRNLNPIYDIATLIKSIPHIIEQVPNTKFIIIGTGSEENNLKALVNKLKVDDCVSFIGTIEHSDLPQYLSSADVYVSTSLSDGGIAVSTLEAMSCGLAPVVTDVGDNKLWIQNEINGYVIPIKNPELLADKIVYLLKNRSLRKKFGGINRKLVKEKADYHKEMDKMEYLYNDLIKRCKR